jgi:hypothetical protein
MKITSSPHIKKDMWSVDYIEISIHRTISRVTRSISGSEIEEMMAFYEFYGPNILKTICRYMLWLRKNSWISEAICVLLLLFWKTIKMKLNS